VASDARASGAVAYSTASGRHSGTTLTDAAMRGWPTPRATDGEKGGPAARGRRGDLQLPAMAVQNWATPSARDWKSGEASDATRARNARPLNEQVAALYPTPKATVYGSSQNGANSSRPSAGTLSLDSMAARGLFPSRRDPATSRAGSASSKSTLVLNPQFVEMLMGWEPGWTAFDSAETAVCLSRSHSHSSRSRSDSA
jgi:hypothetical protein